MTLRPEYSLGHSEYNAFLFAAVGEDKAGLPLTVQTALIRLGFDPWQEAARLSDLPRDAAAGALAATMARLPAEAGDWKPAALPEIAARLVRSLPGRSAPAVPPTDATRDSTRETTRPQIARMTTKTGSAKTGGTTAGGATKWLVWMVLAAALFAGMLALKGNNQFEAAPGSGFAVQQQK